MTSREKLVMEHPDENIDDVVAYRCPSTYGYGDDPGNCLDDPNMTCARCWDREIPGTEPTITEKESKTMEKKTKTQLIEEIRAMQKEIEKLDKYRKYEDLANEMHAIYESYINAGFTKEQAWELFTISLKLSTQMTR